MFALPALLNQTSPPPIITIDSIATDNIIQPPEDQSPVTISGTITNVPQGAIATVNVNGINYTSSVNATVYSVSIPVADVWNWSEDEIVTVSINGVNQTIIVYYPDLILPVLFFSPQYVDRSDITLPVLFFTPQQII